MKFKEKLWEIIFLLAAGFSILAVLLICQFLFANGIPAMHKIGLTDFLLGTKWKPGNDLYGIFPMIVGSVDCNWVVLFVFILVINVGFNVFKNKAL